MAILVLTNSTSWGQVVSFKKLSSQMGYVISEEEAGPLTEEEHYSLRSYISTEDAVYREINNFLRFYPAKYEWYGNSPEDTKVLVSNIDNAIQKVPLLPKDLVLFRGLTLGWRRNKPFALQEEYLDKAYTSTSTSIIVANKFTGKVPKRSALFTMYFNEASRGILISEFEDEVILPRGLKFKIMKKKLRNGFPQYLVQICAVVCLDKIKNLKALEYFNSL